MMTTEIVMEQRAPWPKVLVDLVDKAFYRPGWRLVLENLDRGQGSMGLTFCVYTVGYDTYNPDKGQTYRVVHYFPVPPAAYNEESWKRWLLNRLIEVETHEACEFFQIDGTRPFAPHHGPGWDPYIVLHHGEDVDARTNFRGEVQDTGI
jgi:hypothetical protein